MAAEVSSTPVNGNHSGPHAAFEGGHNGYNPSQSYNTQSTSSQNNTASSTTSEIPKDEVGWYFVEQYYTTLSRSPEKLYLFYNKRSQFVLGDEADKIPVSVGQKAINERIKELDFQDCKVRVTNVDSQASDNNIVIQVIGEISDKSRPHKKFAQTFVLAVQTNGYFVLNDIFRYLLDEEEEAEQVQEDELEQTASTQEPAPSAAPAEVEPETLTSSQDSTKVEESAQLVDQGLQEKPEPTVEVTAPVANGVDNEHEQSTLEVPSRDAGVSTPTATLVEAEKPKEPSPTPALSPVKTTAVPEAPKAPSPAQQAAPAKPSAPKSWASLAAAANRVATPTAASTQATPSAPAPAQPKNAASPAPSAPVAQPPVSEPITADVEVPEAQQDEWTSVGDHRKQQSRAPATNNTQEGPQSRAYIKNVHETVDAKALRSLMEKFGEVLYFDVSRQKNCAFVDFKTPEAYKAAVAANPHQLGEDRIIVEERRLKPGSYPYVPRGGARGGRGGANGAPAQGTPRGGFQGGRGGAFPGRGGRGGAVPRGGRGGAQAV